MLREIVVVGGQVSDKLIARSLEALVERMTETSVLCVTYICHALVGEIIADKVLRRVSASVVDYYQLPCRVSLLHEAENSTAYEPALIECRHYDRKAHFRHVHSDFYVRIEKKSASDDLQFIFSK